MESSNMTTPYITLIDVSYVLPDGRALFSNLHEHFDLRPTGIVGRNGVGKTILARILAGQVQPSEGRCICSGNLYYLAQQVTQQEGVTVADLAGVRCAMDALVRIEMGSAEPEDFDILDDRWDIHQQLVFELGRAGLGHLDTMTPATQLSGGEAMRVALIGAILSKADFLILDEPSNHLDRAGRLALIEQLQHWSSLSRGLLVISHDRQLLETMGRIVELSSLGLRSYGGDYTFYAGNKAREQQNALNQLEHYKLERKREEAAICLQRERQERRMARGNRQAGEANQAKILLGRQKARAEVSAGKLSQQHAAIREQITQRIRDVVQQVENDAPVSVHSLQVIQSAQRRVAQLEAVVLPFAPTATRHIDLILNGQQRVGIIGPNGCGKSTLLKVLAGRLLPFSGEWKLADDSVYLDQQLTNLRSECSVLEQIRQVNCTATESDLRARLAQLGLDAQKIAGPSGLLSGGERLKAALACVLYADPPAQLLLLDEPCNHLDLPSIQALEVMLCNYHGALVVVSHDDAFMNNLGLTHRLLATGDGWQLEPW